MIVTTDDILAQLEKAGVTAYLTTTPERHEANGKDCAHVTFRVKRAKLIGYLWKHREFKKAPAMLHADVGWPRIEFRSRGGSLGLGSLQVALGVFSGRGYADIDEFNPLESWQDFIDHQRHEVLFKGNAQGTS